MPPKIKTEDIFCQITGMQPEPVETIGMDDDNDIPAGWVRISISKSKHTKDYKMALAAVSQMTSAKLQQFDAQLAAIPEENRPSPAEIKRLKSFFNTESKAYFAAHIATISKFNVEEEVIFLAPNSRTGATNDVITRIYEIMDESSTSDDNTGDDESQEGEEDIDDSEEDNEESGEDDNNG